MSPPEPESGTTEERHSAEDSATASAAAHFDAFLREMGLADGDMRRVILTGQIAKIIRTQGRGETADELILRFATPANSEAPGSDRPADPEHFGTFGAVNGTSRGNTASS
ncbi:hypothetical protein ABT126_21980 [Streptomyces sp. NPDC002012]|uniref:hypothetical protein n=1 Tax=Streptomyces sp. NPDC002012 TaxID=3154532 RepID=UPI00331E98AC